jgi:DNA polymerase-3 subunit alpha
LAKQKTKLGAADFVHLHNHTQYSLLDGLTKVPALVRRVKDSGMAAVAITDHGTMSGAIEFYKTAKAAAVKPIIGLEAYVAARTLYDKEPSKDKQNYHLILLAMNSEGYQNLMALTTIANLEGFYYKPRIDRSLLEKHNEGLICLSGCASSEIGEALRQGQYEQAKTTAKWYKKAFGDRYYLEIQDHGHPDHPGHWTEQKVINDQLIRLSQELKIPCVVTCDAHYLEAADQEAHEILLCVQTGSFLSDEQRMSLKDFQLYVNKPEEVIGRWGDEHPEFVTNSRVIADRCDLTIELGKILIPKFPVPKGETEQSYLEKLVYRGLVWRYGHTADKKPISQAVASKLGVAAARKKPCQRTSWNAPSYELQRHR